MKITANIPILVRKFIYLLFISVALWSCKKENTVVNPPSEAHFTNKTDGAFFVTPANTQYKIFVGLTDIAPQDRVVNFTVTSPTGAVAGTHYTIAGGNSITIPAGKALDSITVNGIVSAYASGRKDTLIFTINDGGVKSSSYNKVFKLFMRGPCFEGDLEANKFLGSWNKTNELFGTSAYGPYNIGISAITPITATTGKITVTNIWDFGWGPIDFILDWTDPNNRTVVPVVTNSGIADAGTISSTYAGQQVAVRPFAGQPGTFSFCTGTIVLKMQLGVAGVGFFGSLYTVTPGR